jgi:hypothetical protein
VYTSQGPIVATRRATRLSLIAAAAVLAATQAAAQGAAQSTAQSTRTSTPARSLVPASYPRWEAGGGLALLAISTSDTLAPWETWQQKGEFRADFGRYWTPHLKSEAAVSVTNQWHDYESNLIPIPGQSVPGYSFTEIERRLIAVAPAVTWQFRENAFMHPYVSAGAKVGFLREDLFRQRRTEILPGGRASYEVPGLDEQRLTVLARPFVAGGFKSYLSRATFVRSEVRVAFAEDGVRQFSVGIGLGVDF